MEQRRLLKAFAHAVREYHRMQTAQVTAVLNGKDFPFEDWVEKAAKAKDEARSAILRHREEHGCGNF
jgi:hypothetical protein